MRGVLAELGYADALLARETPEGLMLIDGHLRASLDPEQTVPVLVLDVDEAEADYLLATLDPLSAMADRDAEAIADLLGDVRTGEDAVRDLLETVGGVQPEEGLTDPDEAPPLPPSAVSQRGQVWLLGEHRLMCGDSTDSGDVSRLMAGETARLMVTDPPYGVEYSSPGKRDSSGRLRYGGDLRRKEPIANDDLGEDQAVFWTGALASWPLEGDAYVFSPSGPLISTLCASIEAAGIEHHQWLIWLKSRLVPSRGHYHYRHEHIFYGWRGRSSYNGSRTEDSIWVADKPHRSPEHPTMKPVALCERAIANSSSQGNLVIDPFLGSGSTMIAAERLGRRCYAMEIEPLYVDVAVRRWEEFTGLKAVLE